MHLIRQDDTVVRRRMKRRRVTDIVSSDSDG
jgi:hypothetical protein